MLTIRELDRRFDLHEPAGAVGGEACDIVRAKLKEAADLVAFETPECREQALALTKIEEALYWAIAAIVRPAAE